MEKKHHITREEPVHLAFYVYRIKTLCGTYISDAYMVSVKPEKYQIHTETCKRCLRIWEKK